MGILGDLVSLYLLREIYVEILLKQGVQSSSTLCLNSVLGISDCQDCAK